MYSKRIWLMGGVVAMVAILCGCHGAFEWMNPRYPKNSRIVISGGSITAHTSGGDDWLDAKKSTQANRVKCPKDGTTSQVCVAAHIDPTTIKAVALSDNFEIPVTKGTSAGIRGGIDLKSSWTVVVGAVGPGKKAAPVSLTIQPASNPNCAGGSMGGTCFSISTADFGFGPRNETEGTIFSKHNGRSVCQGEKHCKAFSIQSVTIYGAVPGTIQAKCDDPNPSKGDHGCLVCLKPTKDNKSCEWK